MAAYVSIERKNIDIPIVSRKWCVNGKNLNFVFELQVYMLP
jgi:hypothetical protein